MLEHIVRYLLANQVTFRLSSHPALEPMPAVAHRGLPGGRVARTCLVLVAGRPVICCLLEGARLSLPQLASALGAPVAETDSGVLREPYAYAPGPIPPLGRALGVVTILDERVAAASSMSFAVFSPTDLIDLAMDDFVRLENPRIASFASAGVLPAHAATSAPPRAGSVR